MMKNKFSKFKVESIMESLKGMQPAAAPNFFYTRLKAKMQSTEAKQTWLIFKPAFITTVLSVLLIVNVVSLLYVDRVPTQNTIVKSVVPATIEAFANDYNLHSKSVYE